MSETEVTEAAQVNSVLSYIPHECRVSMTTPGIGNGAIRRAIKARTGKGISAREVNDARRDKLAGVLAVAARFGYRPANERS